jgi:hypothetical protein
MQSKSPSREPSRKHHATPVRESPGLLKRVTDIFYPSPGSTSAKSDLGQQLHLKDAEIERLQEALREKDNIMKQNSTDHRRDVDRRKGHFQKILDDKKQEWDAKERELERYNGQIRRDRDESIRRLEAEVREIGLDRHMMQEQYDAFIRKQQEESFKQMESARWLPSEESKVSGDLYRIKREMRSWAKGTSIKEMSPIQTIDERDFAGLMKDLSCVVLLENNELPKGLSTPKSPSLLLNALLAHDVYTNLFRNPFFFLEDGLGHDLPRAGLDDILDKIYHLAQACKLS